MGHGVPLRHHGPVALRERLPIGRPALRLLRRALSPLHVMRSLSEGNAERVGSREDRATGKARTEKVCIVKKKKKTAKEKERSVRGKEQQDAGHGGEQKQASDPHSSDPLMRGSRSRGTKSCFCSAPEISSGFVQQVASVLRPRGCCLFLLHFLKLQSGFLVRQ